MKTILSLLAVAALASAANVNAKTIKYPEKNPVFTFTLPAGWTAKADKDGTLDCTAGDGSKYGFRLLDMEGAKEASSEAAVDAFLVKLAKDMGEGAGVTDLEVSDLAEKTTANKVKFTRVNASGHAGGKEMAYHLAAFAPTKGHYFILMAGDVTEVDEAHGPAMMEVINSIKPVGGKDADDDDDDDDAAADDDDKE